MPILKEKQTFYLRAYAWVPLIINNANICIEWYKVQTIWAKLLLVWLLVCCRFSLEPASSVHCIFSTLTLNVWFPYLLPPCYLNNLCAASILSQKFLFPIISVHFTLLCSTIFWMFQLSERAWEFDQISGIPPNYFQTRTFIKGCHCSIFSSGTFGNNLIRSEKKLNAPATE